MKKRARVLPAVAAIVAMVLVGCGDEEYTGTDVGMDEPTVTQWTQPRINGPLGAVDQSSADAVMTAALREFFAWQFPHDDGPHDAARRAEPLMDEPFVESHRNSWSAMAQIPGRQWQRWHEEAPDVDVAVTITDDDHPADQPRVRSRVVDVRVTVGDEVVQYAVYVTVEELGWWRVTAMDVMSPTISATTTTNTE